MKKLQNLFSLFLIWIALRIDPDVVQCLNITQKIIMGDPKDLSYIPEIEQQRLMIQSVAQKALGYFRDRIQLTQNNQTKTITATLKLYFLQKK